MATRVSFSNLNNQQVDLEMLSHPKLRLGLQRTRAFLSDLAVNPSPIIKFKFQCVMSMETSVPHNSKLVYPELQQRFYSRVFVSLEDSPLLS